MSEIDRNHRMTMTAYTSGYCLIIRFLLCTLFRSGCGYYCRNIRILWKYRRSENLIRISGKYARSVDIIRTSGIYPHCVHIIRISWILSALSGHFKFVHCANCTEIVILVQLWGLRLVQLVQHTVTPTKHDFISSVRLRHYDIVWPRPTQAAMWLSEGRRID